LGGSSIALTSIKACTYNLLDAQIPQEVYMELVQIYKTPPELTGSVLCLAWSPDSNYLAHGNTRGILCIWRTENKTVEQKIQAHIHPNSPSPTIGEIRSIDWHPSGRLVASGATDTYVRIWKLGEAKPFKEHHRHKDWVYSVTFSPDGRTLASSSGDDTILVWNLEKSSQYRKIPGTAKAAITCLSWAPDGQVIAAGNRNNVVRLYPLALNESVRMLRKHSDSITAVDFSKDGDLLATASRDSMIYLWDTTTRKLAQTLTGHQGRVYSVEFSPDGKMLVSGGDDGYIYIWRVTDGQCICKVDSHEEIRSVRWRPNDNEIASGGTDQSICFWKLNT
jgi:WD40 repeat protein